MLLKSVNKLPEPGKIKTKPDESCLCEKEAANRYAFMRNEFNFFYSFTKINKVKFYRFLDFC